MPMKILQLLKIQYPIIQAGMVWCSGWELASASANAGMLGVIGSGSMYPDILDHHIKKCQAATQNPFAVNVPLLYPDIEKHLDVILSNGVKTVITSAGNPAKYTALLKKEGITVIHVVSSSKFALKAQDAGVDAVIAEGFEAGGHNGREETTTLCLIPQVCEAVEIPVVAAGGISSGKSLYAMLALGADGVQIGSRFVASAESSAHSAFKQKVVDSKEGDTLLTLKELAPVRLIKNGFYQAVDQAYAKGATTEELRELLGRGRAKKGMFEGELENGELEIGQVSAGIDNIKPVAEIVKEIISEYEETREAMYLRSMSL
ncbi:MAG: enoyl-[acyl-carrier protein] reductase II [Flammeovirgaceae bacterium]|jgi:enoyl-[acyl-carrier protein] reductase II